MNALKKIQENVNYKMLYPVQDGLIFTIKSLPDDHAVRFEMQNMINLKVRETYPASRPLSPARECAFFVPDGKISNRDFLHPLMGLLEKVQQKSLEALTKSSSMHEGPAEFWITRSQSSLTIRARPIKNAASPVQKGMKAFALALNQSFKGPVRDGEEFNWSCNFWNHHDANCAMVAWNDIFAFLVHKKEPNGEPLAVAKKFAEEAKDQILPQQLVEWRLEELAQAGAAVKKSKI